MKDSLAMDQDYMLWWLILHMRRAMFKARSKELLQYGITTAEAAALFVIHVNDNKVTPTEISRWLLRESHSTSCLLARMEKDGLISRTKDLDRKNLVRVTMTEKGHQILNKASKRVSTE